MHPNAQLIQTFYESFKNLDTDGMKRCYHPKVEFSDPIFPHLKGDQVTAMWAMLISNLKKGGKIWLLECTNISANDLQGTCHWEAHYILSATGRKVHNIIEATFLFQDGSIIKHVDSFNFYRWARMAFGLTGILLGWLPYFKKSVRRKVGHQLERYISKHQ